MEQGPVAYKLSTQQLEQLNFTLTREQLSRLDANQRSVLGARFANDGRIPGGLVVEVEKTIVKTKLGDSLIDNANVVGGGLELKTSQIPNSGLGLYAVKDFPRDAVITMYEGTFVTQEVLDELDAADNSRYVITVKNVEPYAAINGISDIMDAFGKGGGSFVNDPRNAALHNCDFFQLVTGQVYICSTRQIQKGEELFIPYRGSYWEGREVTMFDPVEPLVGIVERKPNELNRRTDGKFKKGTKRSIQQVQDEDGNFTTANNSTHGFL